MEQSERNLKSIVFWTLGSVILGIALANALFCWGFTIDDPWIAYRYAENVVAGRGLVFNPGERLEAYSSFLHILILAGIRWLSLDLDTFSRLLGVFAHLATIAFLLIVGWQTSDKRPVLFRCIAPALLAMHFSAAAWAVGGLETSFVGFLLLATLFLYGKEEANAFGFRWSAVLLFLIAMARVEGALVFFCLVAHQILTWFFGKRKIDARTIIWFFTFVIFFGIYTLLRWSYFGALLPNTYYAKATGPLKDQWIAGFKYGLWFLLYSGILPLLFCFIPFFFAQTRRRVLPWGLVLAGYCGFVVHCGGDWMPFYRFFVPLLPLLYWLFQEGAWESIRQSDQSNNRRLKSNAVVLVGLALMANLAGNVLLYTFEGAPILGRVRRGTLIKQYFEVGEYLKAAGNPTQLLAGEEAGVLPYVSGMRFLDIMGVVDYHIARQPGLMHWKSDPHYVLKRKPNFVVLRALPEKQNGQWIAGTPAGQALFDHVEFKSQYSLVKTFVRGDDFVPKWQWRDIGPNKDLFLVFKRNDEKAT